MKKLKLQGNLGIIALTIVSVLVGVLLIHHPSDATGVRNQQMIELNLIDAVREPQDLGLDYLIQEPAQLMAGLMDNIRYAQGEVSQMTDNIKVAFELGTNSPIRMGSLPDGGRITRSGYEAVGYINASGQPQAFTPAFLAAMFNIEVNNRGQLVMTPEAQQTWVADASGAFIQARRSPALDLIVHPKRTRKVYLVPRANANAICRDALNSVLNRRLRPLGYAPRRPRRTIPLW